MLFSGKTIAMFKCRANLLFLKKEHLRKGHWYR